MKWRKLLSGLCVGIVLLIFMSPSLWAGEPGKLIMDTMDRGLAILKEPSLFEDQGEKPSAEEKAKERRQRLWEEISPMFDFEETSKRTLGRYWQERSLSEKREFVKLFTNILKDTYVGKADSGERVVYLGEKQEDNYATVQTRFITRTGAEISVDFRLLNNQGKWKVYDAIIEGVSLVNNYRSQFNSILARSSYAGLVQKIKGKSRDEISTK